MELNKKRLQKGELDGGVSHQIQMDIDLNVPDANEDIMKILQSDGVLHITETVMMEQYIKLVGTVEYRILYATDDQDHRVNCLEGKMPVEELVYTEGELDRKYSVKCNQLDVATHVIHSRKINVRAVAELSVNSITIIQEEVTTGVETNEEVMTKLSHKKVLQLNQNKKDTYRIKEEVKLPGMKENIGSILTSRMGCHKIDTRAEQDYISFRGEFQFFCMYISQEWKEDWVDVTIPFEGKVQCYGITEEMYHLVDSDIQDLSVDVQMDEDGELRILGIEATLKMDITVYEEEELEILEDMYALNKKCQIEKKKVHTESLLMQNQSRCKVMESLALPELRDELLQICHCDGMVQTDKVEFTQLGIEIDGILHVNFLYVKGNDMEPYASWQGMIPFSHVIECKAQGEISFSLDGKLEQLSITMTGNDEVEVKAVLGYQSLVKESEIIEVIDTVEVVPYSKAELESHAGIIGYIYRDGDVLWDLAKKYHTTVESILKLNDLQEKDVKAGHKLLIFKENLSIL